MFRRMLSNTRKPIGRLAAATPVRAHGHSHSHGHTHSHGRIEPEIVGRSHRQCQIATAVGGATNVFFCTTKIWLGSSGGSVALVADGFHALTDILADVVSFSTLTLSRKKLPRCRFPFGIGRLETSGAIFVSGILLLGGFTLLVQSLSSCAGDLRSLAGSMIPGEGGTVMHLVNALTTAVGSVLFFGHGGGGAHAAAGASPTEPPFTAAADAHQDHPHHPASSPHDHGHKHSHFELTQYDERTGEAIVMWAMVLLAASSVVCKEMLFRWSKRVGERAGSRVVVANAYHHRADAWSGGVALVGVCGQMMGIPGVDGVSGLVVSISVCKMGYGLLRDSILEFFDHQRAEDVARVRKQLMKFYVFLEEEGKMRLEISESDAEEGKDLAQGKLPSHGAESTAKSESPSARIATNSVSSQWNPEMNKMRFVNVFLTRHGRFYVVHMKVLLRDDFTALQLQTALSKLNAYLSQSLSIQDVFASVQVCSDTAIPRKEYIKLHNHDTNEEGKHAEKKDTEVYVAAQGDLVNPTLEDCLHILIDFHAFPHGIQYNWKKREIYVVVKRHTDCLRDVESVAKMFGCKLIESNFQKN